MCKILRKTTAIVVVCLFTANNLAWAQPSDLNTATLAPPLRAADLKFRDKYILCEFALSLEGAKHYINEQVGSEKNIFKNAWARRRTETIQNIYDPLTRGRIRGRVDGLRSVVFVRVAGLLSSTGEAAFVDLIGEIDASKEFGGLPVVYIDSILSDTPDRCVQKHEIDEIIQWEDFGQNVLGIDTNGDMAAWIRRHLEFADENLEQTDYKGLNAIQIAELFHGYSYPLRDLYSYLKNAADKGSAELDHKYISEMLHRYPAEKTEGIKIAAKHDGTDGGETPLPAENPLMSGPFSELKPGFTPIPVDGRPILAFGSSSTEGVVDRESLSYPAILQRMIGHTVINAGSGGERIEGTPIYKPTLGVSRLPGELDRYNPSLLILWHGRNDLFDGKDEELIGRALSQMIDEAKKRNIQVLLLGSGAFGALKDADIYQRVAKEKNVPFLRGIYKDVLYSTERMSDDIHANAEGNFIFAGRISEFLRTQGALDTRAGTATLNLRTIYLIELIELLNRNIFLIQGPWAPPGKSTYYYNDKKYLGFEGENFNRLNFSKIMDMNDQQLDEISRILVDIIRDRVRLGKLSDMRTYHDGDEERLRGLTEKLNMRIPGFTAISTLTGKKSAAPNLTDKRILVIPVPPMVRQGAHEAIKYFYDCHRGIAEPIYNEALEEFRGIFSIEQLMYEPSSIEPLSRDTSQLSKTTILYMLAHFLHVMAQYEVLKYEAEHPVPLDYVTGDSIGLETAMVISGALTRREFIHFLKGRFDMMPQIMETTYARLIVPFVSPDQIKALVQPHQIEVVSYGGDNTALVIARSSSKEETQSIAESVAQKMQIPVEYIRVTFPSSRYVHNSFYGDWFSDGLKKLVDQISFKNPQIPIIDSSVDSFAHLRILNTAEDARQVFLTSILSTAYWHQALNTIQYSTSNLIWLNSTPESSEELKRYLGAWRPIESKGPPSPSQQADGRSADEDNKVSPAADTALTSQNIPDIENLRKILNISMLKREKQDELRYYTVRYDITKIQQGSLAEELLKMYVKNILPAWFSGKDRFELIPSIANDQSLVSFECYNSQSRDQLIGESHVDVDEDISDKAIQLIGMLNMAFIASQIPKDMPADEASKYDNLISFIKSQYKDICGQELAVDLLKDTSKGINIRLPRAALVPIDKVEEYYRLTIRQLARAA